MDGMAARILKPEPTVGHQASLADLRVPTTSEGQRMGTDTEAAQGPSRDRGRSKPWRPSRRDNAGAQGGCSVTSSVE